MGDRPRSSDPKGGRVIERAIYNRFALPLGLAGFRVAALFDQKARTGLLRRKNLAAELSHKVSRLGPGKRVLVHVSSVGEYLQARPVLRTLRQSFPAINFVLSFFSPSLEPTLAKGVEAEFATYLPFDRKADAEKFLQILDPALIIFSCYDLWPNLIWRAKERGVKVALVNAGLAENSGKLNPLARWWFAGVYRELDLILAASEEDRAAIAGLGVNAGKIITAGNARFDETIARINAIAPDDPLIAAVMKWRGNPREFCLAVGSSWPEDEAALVPAIAGIWLERKPLKLVIAPHEPSGDRVRELSRRLAAAGRGPALLSEIEAGKPAGDAKALIVDGVGRLYKLYQAADLAFVGGSFRKEVHNVMEPAGFGIPVLFGPRINNSLEAIKLAERKGGFVVRSSEEIRGRVTAFMESGEKRAGAGQRALELVRENQGAAERICKILAGVFPQIFPAERAR